MITEYGDQLHIGGGPAVHGGTVADLAEQTWADYLAVMEAGMAAHPRSLQKMIGPSEIGDPCNRALLHKLAGTPEPPRGPAWKPQVGTACHDQQERWFSNPALVGVDPASDRYLVEQTITCGMIGPHPLKGHTDLVDLMTGGVIDHKFVGKTKLQHYRRSGPSQLYRVQAHTYGKGWADEGYPVRFVMICFFPRDGEFKEGFNWWEPYDPAVAEWALARMNMLYSMLQGLGLEGALALFPDPCGDQYCDYCRADRAAAMQSNPFQTK